MQIDLRKRKTRSNVLHIVSLFSWQRNNMFTSIAPWRDAKKKRTEYIVSTMLGFCSTNSSTSAQASVEEKKIKLLYFCIVSGVNRGVERKAHFQFPIMYHISKNRLMISNLFFVLSCLRCEGKDLPLLCTSYIFLC